MKIKNHQYLGLSAIGWMLMVPVWGNYLIEKGSMFAAAMMLLSFFLFIFFSLRTFDSYNKRK